MVHVQKLITELTAIDRCPTVVEEELQNVEDIWMMSELFISFLHSHLSDPLVPYELGTFVIRSLHLSHSTPSNVSHRWMYIPITFSSHLLLLSPHTSFPTLWVLFIFWHHLSVLTFNHLQKVLSFATSGPAHSTLSNL